MYYTVYDKCGKEMYDRVAQLMKLAEKNDRSGFFDLAEESREFFGSDYSLFETAVTAGLMARNKAEILDDFLTAMGDSCFGNTEILSHLAGILIRERRCGEAVKAFIVRMSDELLEKSYILFSAAMADDLEIFRHLYTENFYSFGSSLLLCGIFKSKKVLDFITDRGSRFINGNIPCPVNFKNMINDRHDISEADNFFAENEDILIKWLDNIYSIYFSGEKPEKACEILMDIAEKLGIIVNRSDDLSILRQQRSYYAGAKKIIMRKIMRELYILLRFGQKTNDLSYFIPEDMPCDGYIDILMKIAGDEPFIAYDGLTVKSEDIAGLPESLKNKLTVRLVKNFGISDIELLQDIVKLEIDVGNKATADSLSFLLMPFGAPHEERRENQRKLVSHLIDNGFCTVEKMTEIAYSVKNFDIIKLLYNYGNERNDPDKKQKGA